MEPVQKKKNKTKRLFSLKKKSNQQNGDDMKNEDQQSKEPRLISTSSEVSIDEKEEVTTLALSVEEDYEVFVTAVPVHNEDENILNMEEKTETHDGFEWVSNVTGPYLDKAKSVSSEILDQLAPHVEEGKKHLNQIEYSATFHEILIDITEKVDQRAADYLNYLIDHFPVVKTPTWDLVQQFKVITQQLM